MTQSRNAIWQYTTATPQAQNLPASVLAPGSGRTGKPASMANAANLPGYVSDIGYTAPSLFDYAPVTRENRGRRIPLSIAEGTNGRDLVGTYQPHDFAVAKYTQSQNRSSGNWQDMAFPDVFRDLVQQQQVTRYRVNSITRPARLLDPNTYFLGYYTDTTTQAAIGAANLGAMGSQ